MYAMLLYTSGSISPATWTYNGLCGCQYCSERQRYYTIDPCGCSLNIRE